MKVEHPIRDNYVGWWQMIKIITDIPLWKWVEARFWLGVIAHSVGSMNGLE